MNNDFIKYGNVFSATGLMQLYCLTTTIVVASIALLFIHQKVFVS